MNEVKKKNNYTMFCYNNKDYKQSFSKSQCYIFKIDECKTIKISISIILLLEEIHYIHLYILNPSFTDFYVVLRTPACCTMVLGK